MLNVCDLQPENQDRTGRRLVVYTELVHCALQHGIGHPDNKVNVAQLQATTLSSSLVIPGLADALTSHVLSSSSTKDESRASEKLLFQLFKEANENEMSKHSKALAFNVASRYDASDDDESTTSTSALTCAMRLCAQRRQCEYDYTKMHIP